MDDDKSGALDKDEVAQAAAMLSNALGFVMSADDIDDEYRLR